MKNSRIVPYIILFLLILLSIVDSFLIIKILFNFVLIIFNLDFYIIDSLFNIFIFLAISIVIFFLNYALFLKIINQFDNLNYRVYSFFPYYRKYKLYGNSYLIEYEKYKFYSFIRKNLKTIFYDFIRSKRLYYLFLVFLYIIYFSFVFMTREEIKYSISFNKNVVIEGEKFETNIYFRDFSGIKEVVLVIIYPTNNQKIVKKYQLNLLKRKIYYEFYPKDNFYFYYVFKTDFNIIKTKKIYIEVKKFPRLLEAKLIISYPSYIKNKKDTLSYIKEASYILNQYSNLRLKLRFSENITGTLFIGKKYYVKNSNLIDLNNIIYKPNPFRIKLKVFNKDSLFFKDSLGPYINIVRDNLPNIILLYPDSISKIPSNEIVNFKLFAFDDWGISKIYFIFKIHSKIRSIIYDTSYYSFKSFPQTAPLNYSYNLKKYGLFPNDSIFYYIKVYDYRGKFLPKSKLIGPFIIYYPSMLSLYKEVDNFSNNVASAYYQRADNNNLERFLYKTKIGEISKQEKIDYMEKEIERLNYLDSITNLIKKRLFDYNNQIDNKELREKLKALDELLNDSLIKKWKSMFEKNLEDSLKNLDNRRLKKMLEKYNLDIKKELKNLDMAIKQLKRLKKLLKKEFLKKKINTIKEDLENILEKENYNRKEIKNSLKKDIKDLENLPRDEFSKAENDSINKAISDLNKAYKNINNEIEFKKNIYSAINKLSSITKDKNSLNSSSGISIPQGLWISPVYLSMIITKYLKNKDDFFYDLFKNYYNDFYNFVKSDNFDIRAYNMIKDYFNRINSYIKNIEVQDNLAVYKVPFYLKLIKRELDNLSYILYLIEDQAKGQGSSSGSSKQKSLKDILSTLKNISLQQAFINSLTYSILKQISKGKNIESLKNDIETIKKMQKDVLEKLKELEGTIGKSSNSALKSQFSQLIEKAQDSYNKLNNLMVNKQNILKVQKDLLENLKKTITGISYKKSEDKKRKAEVAKKSFYQRVYKDSIEVNDFYIKSYENYIYFILNYKNKLNHPELYNKYINNLLKKNK